MKIKPFLFASAIAMLWIQPSISIAQDTIDYFGQTPPGKTVTKFAPGLISTTGIQDFYVSFSPDGTEVFYGNQNERFYAEYKDGAWESFTKYEAPEGYKSAVFSPVEGLMYVWGGTGLKLGYMTREGDTWSPVKEVASAGMKAWPSCTEDSLVYYLGDNNIIYFSKFNGTTHETPKVLPFPINDNPAFRPNDVCISVEGDYLVYLNDGGSGIKGMLVSFKKNENHWTYPKAVSDYYLTSGSVPYFGQRTKMSPDGKYLFAANYPPNGDMDLFWVSTSIFEDARNSNFAPYLKNRIPIQTVTVGNQFTFTIPDSIFVDDDGNETLTLTAKLSNGNDLPDSLSFDPLTNHFSGKLTQAKNFNIKVTATDTAGASVSDIFALTVEPATAIENLKINNNITAFPNPASQTIQIKGIDMQMNEANYKLIDLNGRIIKQGKLDSETIDISKLPKGIYILNLHSNEGIITEKIVIE